MKRFIVYFICTIILFSCSKEQKETVDVSSIPVKISIDRFEQEFYDMPVDSLSFLKERYRMLFPSHVPDSVWLNRWSNDEERYLYEESQLVFATVENLEQDLIQLFKHTIHYFPLFNPPRVITYISDLDHEYPVIYADSLLFISLDMYLGKNNIVYQDFPMYLAQNYNPENIVVDVAQEMVNRFYPKVRSRSFLAKIIEEGKRMYLVDRLLPDVSNPIKMGYTEEKYNWAVQNELNIWKYFIEKELLYSNDAELEARFLVRAPFSKFYQQADRDSPGRIGVWLGWQIVAAYMRTNTVTLQQLMRTDSEEIFKNSNYKPRK